MAPLSLADFPLLNYDVTHGFHETSAIAGVGFWNITLASDAGVVDAGVVVNGLSKYALLSSRDMQSSSPAGDEYVHILTAESGYAAKLYVTYTVSGSSIHYYTLHGPYLETGEIYSGIINVTFSAENRADVIYIFNGSDGLSDTVTIESSFLGICLKWNITSDMTYMRSYYFDASLTDEVWLFVPDTSNPFEVTSLYGISVADLAGLTDAYVSTMKNVDGYTRIIEQQKLDYINPMPFYLIMFQQYTLRVTSDQGTWDFNLPADSVTTKSYAVTRDMITPVFSGYNITLTATRVNSTSISFLFYDPLGDTSSVSSSIIYYSAGVWFVVATQTVASYIQSYTTTVNATTNYFVNVTAVVDGETETWVLSVPALLDSAVQFDLTNGFDLFGSWPILARNLLGFIILLVFLGLGSYRDSEFFIGVTALIALFLWAIGLLVIPLASAAIVLVVVAWLYIHKGKQEIRET
jgi:hypothetical protein